MRFDQGAFTKSHRADTGRIAIIERNACPIFVTNSREKFLRKSVTRNNLFVSLDADAVPCFSPVKITGDFFCPQSKSL
jgi:hypothetical protein